MHEFVLFLPLILSMIALVLTYSGGWDCTFFDGIGLPWQGNYYGLWTVESTQGHCVLWDTLYYSNSVDPPIYAAKVMVMVSMTFGLAIVDGLALVNCFHFINWGIGFIFLILLIVSIATSMIYNVWLAFYLCLHILIVLTARETLSHQGKVGLARWRISPKGSRAFGGSMVTCFGLNMLTLVSMSSVFCKNQCKADPANLGNAGSLLTQEIIYQNCEAGSPCTLGAAAIMTIVGGVVWLVAGVLAFVYGVQRHWEGDDDAPEPQASTKEVIIETFPDGTSKSASVAAAAAVEAPIFDQQAAQPEGQTEPTVSSPRAMGEETPHEQAAQPEGETEPMGEETPQEDDCDEAHHIRKYHPERRTWGQKVCCDHRATPRSKKEKAIFWLSRIGYGVILVIFILIVILLSGAKVEENRVARQPSTSPNFITDIVCGFDANLEFKTFQNPIDALSANYTIAHCGACSNCSNMPDIKAYVLTRKTIAQTAMKCSTQAIFGGEPKLSRCLTDNIGFSPPCNQCWVDDMLCDKRLCLFTCLKSIFTGTKRNNNEGATNSVTDIGGQRNGWMNWCLNCDEHMCGTDFVTCSGVARRRLGIQSEIDRGSKEQCPHVTVDWTTYFE